MVAFHAFDWGINKFYTSAAEGNHAFADAIDGKLTGGGFAHDASLADVFATGFEFRL